MIRTLITKTALAVCLSAFCLSSASAQTGLTGVWHNTDKKTRGITKLVITNSLGGAKIRAWGQCHPKDCDWGTRKLHVLGSSVSSKVKPYGFAIYGQKFAVRYLSLRRSGKYLVAEINTIFLDKSGRSNYRSIYTFSSVRRTLPLGTKIRAIRIQK